MKKIYIVMLIITAILLFSTGFYAYNYYNAIPKTPDYSCDLKRVLRIVNKAYSTGHDYIYFTIASVNGNDNMDIIKLDVNNYDYLEEGKWYVFDFKVDKHIKDKYKGFKYPIYSLRDIVDNYKSITIMPFTDDVNPMIENVCK